MAKVSLREFPTDILVDATKSHEAVFVHPDQGIYADERVATVFKQIDERYKADKGARIRFMGKSVQHFKVSGTFGYPAGINIAYESGPSDAESDEVLIVTSPLNDGRPKSSPDAMVDYVNTPDPSFAQIARVKPNSWSPITKLDIGFQVAELSGRPMPVLQLFSRVPPRAFHAAERLRLLQGDYSGYGRIALAGVNYINAVRQAEGKTPVTKAHFFGAGIAQRALGAARWSAENQDIFEVVSAHAMNLALHRGLGVAVDHLQQRKINEPSGIEMPQGHKRIDEPLMRKDIDQRGSDTLQMYGRQAWAIKDLAATILPLMFAYKPTVNDVESLMGGGVPVRVTNGLNVGMAINTLRLLPIGDPMMRYSTIVGLEGQKVGMMANEHAGVVGIAMNLGIRDYDAQHKSAK